MVSVRHGWPHCHPCSDQRRGESAARM